MTGYEKPLPPTPLGHQAAIPSSQPASRDDIQMTNYGNRDLRRRNEELTKALSAKNVEIQKLTRALSAKNVEVQELHSIMQQRDRSTARLFRDLRAVVETHQDAKIEQPQAPGQYGGTSVSAFTDSDDSFF